MRSSGSIVHVSQQSKRSKSIRLKPKSKRLLDQIEKANRFRWDWWRQRCGALLPPRGRDGRERQTWDATKSYSSNCAELGHYYGTRRNLQRLIRFIKLNEVQKA